MTAPDTDPLWSRPPAEWSAEDRSAAVDIYKTMVEMADKVSERRQTANAFYLSVNTALIGASAYVGMTAGDLLGLALISITGLAVALLWVRNIQSYRDLNEGKFHVIVEIERTLPIAPFTSEWAFLERDRPKGRYRPFHAVETLVPFVFAGLHGAQLARAVPWEALWQAISALGGPSP